MYLSREAIGAMNASLYDGVRGGSAAARRVFPDCPSLELIRCGWLTVVAGTQTGCMPAGIRAVIAHWPEESSPLVRISTPMRRYRSNPLPSPRPDRPPPKGVSAVVTMTSSPSPAMDTT